MKLRYRRLRYNQLYYPRYVIFENGRLVDLKLRKWKSLHMRGDGYEGYSVKNPMTGRWDWIMKHRAVLESFSGANAVLPIAAHRPGTTRADGALGTCDWNDDRGNRNDRIEAGTFSTGHDTKPGKLKEKIDELLRLYDAGASQRWLARHFGCSRAAIIYQLRTKGRTA